MMGSPVKMMKWLRDHSVPVEKAKQMTGEALEGLLTIGVLTDSEKPSYVEKYQMVRERAKASLKK